MASPDFLGYSQLAQQQPGALNAAMKQGLQTYGTLQQLGIQKQQAQQQAQQAQQQAVLFPLIQQQMQQQVQQEPQVFATQQQQARLDIQKTAIGNAASQMSNQDLQYHIVKNDLADIYASPKNQQQQLFASKQKEWKNIGIDTSKIPQNYDAETQAEAQQAYQNSPAVAQQRKDMVDIFKTTLQGKMATQTAVAKAQAENANKLPAQQEAFGKEEGTKNSDYFDDVNKASSSASDVYNQASKMIGLAGQIPKEMGYINQGKAYFSDKGRELMSNSKQMILTLFAQMPHIGRSGTTLINFIKDSKPGTSMPYETFVKVASWYKALSSLAMEKNQMAQVLKQNGVTDRNQINNIWDRFQDAYPASDDKGNVNLPNIKMWPQFLQKNPGVISGFSGGETQQQPPDITGKQMPGQVGAMPSGGQGAQQQPPLAGSPYYTSYNPYTGTGGK